MFISIIGGTAGIVVGVMAASTAGVTVTVESVGWRSDTRQRHLHGRHCRPWRSGRRQGEPHLCPRH